MKMLILVVFTLLSPVSLASDSVETHIVKMIDKYRSLYLYEDSGRSVTNFTKQDGSSYSNLLTFTTKYKKSDSLYFQWIRPQDEIEKKLNKMLGESNTLGGDKVYTLWQDKTGIFSKYPFDEREKYSSLAAGLSGATGISSGIAWLVPRFLSSEISCSPSLGAIKSEILKSNSNTIIIKQTHSEGVITVLHIDKETYLLRMYEVTQSLSNGVKTYQVVKYNTKEVKGSDQIKGSEHLKDQGVSDQGIRTLEK